MTDISSLLPFMAITEAIITVIGISLLFIVGILIMIFSFYKKVQQGNALIINKMSKVEVKFTGGVSVPIIHKAEFMDISVKAMEIERIGRNGLICQDNIRADIKVTFYVRVNKTEGDVLKVAQSVGCERASASKTLEELFSAKFSEALKTVGKQMEFTTLFTDRDVFKENIISVIGEDLNGYKLEDAAIDYLEQTPVESLDPDNILDAQGIRKITKLTSTEAISTNEFVQNREKTIKKQNVEARETILELEKQQADAEARQQREISIIQAREESQIEQVRAEENLKFERARIQTDEELQVATENKDRQIEIAAKAKERTVAIETERVKRDQELEQVERERVVAIKEVEKNKAIEIEQKKIQEAIRERVMVEKTVVTEKEKIEDTKVIAEAERKKNAQIIEAEMKAKEEMIKEINAAEAQEKAAKHLYEQRLIDAEAHRVTAEKESEAKKVLAEGIVAEESAQGLAAIKVQEAEANAIELTANAEAKGIEARGKAEAHVVTSKGIAEAETLTAKFDAEADGLTKKADAMKKLDGVGREHEEFKLELEKEIKIEMAKMNVQKDVIESQAGILSEAVKTANIDIVGGDGKFMDSFFKSITLSKSIDGFVDRNETLKQLTDGDLSGMAKKLGGLISQSGLNTEDIKNLSVSALLAKLVLSKDEKIQSEAQILEGQLGSLAPHFGGMKMKDLLALVLAK